MSNCVYKDDCEIVCIKMTAKFLPARLKMAQLVKISFIVFHLTRLIFMDKTSDLDTLADLGEGTGGPGSHPYFGKKNKIK